MDQQNLTINGQIPQTSMSVEFVRRKKCTDIDVLTFVS